LPLTRSELHGVWNAAVFAIQHQTEISVRYDQFIFIFNFYNSVNCFRSCDNGQQADKLNAVEKVLDVLWRAMKQEDGIHGKRDKREEKIDVSALSRCNQLGLIAVRLCVAND
jgi:hypothetical protein